MQCDEELSSTSWYGASSLKKACNQKLGELHRLFGFSSPAKVGLPYSFCMPARHVAMRKSAVQQEVDRGVR